MAVVDQEDTGVRFLGFGARLAEARLERGLDLGDVERATKISRRYLAALEEEDLDAFPADVYARGFLRTYARYLGLDADAYVDEYARRTAPPAAPAPEASRRRRSAGRRRRRRVVTAAVLAALGLAALGAELARGPAAEPDVAPAPARPGPFGTPPEGAGLGPAAAAAAAAPADEASAPEPEARDRGPAPPPLVVRATGGSSWVAVRFGGAGGRTVWEGSLRAGRTLRFGLSRPLWIRVGAPERVRVRAGDRTIRLRRGRDGVVVRAAKRG